MGVNGVLAPCGVAPEDMFRGWPGRSGRLERAQGSSRAGLQGVAKVRWKEKWTSVLMGKSSGDGLHFRNVMSLFLSTYLSFGRRFYRNGPLFVFFIAEFCSLFAGSQKTASVDGAFVVQVGTHGVRKDNEKKRSQVHITAREPFRR